VIQRQIEAALEREAARFFAQYEAELSASMRRALTDYFENKRGSSVFKKIFDCFAVGVDKVNPLGKYPRYR
jgi:hypothetical protein